MRDTNISYAQANLVYDSMTRIFEDAITTGATVRVGRVGAIVAVRRPPREIRMGFEVGKGRKVKKVTRIYNLDSRMSFSFRVYEKFIQSHSLHWFDREEDTSIS